MICRISYLESSVVIKLLPQRYFYFSFCLQGAFELLLWRVLISLFEGIPLGMVHVCLLVYMLEIKWTNIWDVIKIVLGTRNVLGKLQHHFSSLGAVILPYVNWIIFLEEQILCACCCSQDVVAGKVHQHLCLTLKDEWRRQLVSNIFAVTALRATRASHAAGAVGSFWRKNCLNISSMPAFFPPGNSIHVSQSEN